MPIIIRQSWEDFVSKGRWAFLCFRKRLSNLWTKLNSDTIIQAPHWSPKLYYPCNFRVMRSIILDLLWCVKKWVYVLLSPSQLLRDISNRVGFYDAYLSSNNILSLLFWHAWLNSLDLMPLDPPKKDRNQHFCCLLRPICYPKFKGLFEIGQLENCRGCRFFQVWKWNIAWLFSEG